LTTLTTVPPTTKLHDPSDDLQLDDEPGAAFEADGSPDFIHQRLFPIFERLPRLTTFVIGKITILGYMIIYNPVRLDDSLIIPPQPLKRHLSSISLYLTGPGLRLTGLLLMFPLRVVAQSTDAVSGRSSLLTTLTNEPDSGTRPALTPEDPWIYAVCLTMIIAGGLYMAWRWWDTVACMPLLSLMGILTAASSVAWTVVAFTVEPSDHRRYLGLAGWCMCAMAFLSEPIPGISHIDRRALSQFDIMGPIVCLIAIKIISGSIDLESMNFLSIGFTMWWILLRLITHYARKSQPGDEEDGNGNAMDTLGDPAAVADSVDNLQDATSTAVS
jgi:hypothetical protein